MHTKTVTMCGLVITLLMLSPARGQIRYGEPAAGNVQFHYSNWELSNEGSVEIKLTQQSFPMSAFVPLRDNLEMNVMLSGASSDFESDLVDATLSGSADLSVQLSQSLARDQVVVSLGLNLPTGKKKLNMEEQWVLEGLTYSFLDLPSRKLGSGPGFNALVGAAQASGSFQYGAGVMFQYSGSYEPYEAAADYDPGEEISINAGGAYVTEKAVLSLDAVYSLFTNDVSDGNRVFRQSPLVDIRAGFGQVLNKATLNLNLRYVLRGDNKWYAGVSDDPVLAAKLFGNEFHAYGGLSYSFSERVHVTPSIETRYYAGDEFEFGSSTLFGGGLTNNFSLTDNFSLMAGGKFYSGSVHSERFGLRLDLTGLQLSAGLTATL